MNSRLIWVYVALVAVTFSATFAVLSFDRFSLVVITLWMILGIWAIPSIKNPGALALTLTGVMLLLSVGASLPSATGALLILIAALVTFWLRSMCDVPPVWFALAVLLALYAAVVQSLQPVANSDPDILNGFIRTYLLGAALATFAARRHMLRVTGPSLLVSCFICASFVVSLITGFPARQYNDARLSGYLNGGTVRPSGWAASPNEMAAVLGLGLMLLLVVWVRAKSRRNGYFIITGAITLGAILATGTRSVLVASLLATAAIVIGGGGSRMSSRRRLLLVAGLIAAAIAATVTTSGDRDLFGRGADGSAVYRSDVTARVWERLFSGEAPFVGAGLVLGNQVPENRLTSGIQIVDNSFFYVASYLGVLGLVLLCGIILCLSVLCLRTRSPALPLLVYLICMMFFENIVAWPSTSIVMIICGGIIGWSASRGEQRTIFWAHRIDQPSASGAGRSSRGVARHIRRNNRLGS